VVVSSYPRETLKHIREVLGWEVRDGGEGIHRVEGGQPLVMQIIESGKLDVGEDLWLKELRHNLKVENLDRIFEESKKYKEEYMEAYLDIIIRANAERLEEHMSRKTVEEVLIKTGWAAEFEARGEARNLKEALELLRKGTTTEELMRRFEERLNALSTGNGYDAQQE
jgi:hypothetical protein